MPTGWESARSALLSILMMLLLSVTDVVPQHQPLHGLLLIAVKTAAEAASLRARIVGGESFEELAMSHSIDPSAAAGGYLGPVALGDLTPEIQKAFAGSARRDIGPIVKIGDKYMLLQLLTAQETRWKTQSDAGGRAYGQRKFAEAEQFLVAAAREAEGFGPQDRRLIQSLNSLGRLYQDEAKYAEAEPLFQRSLEIVKKAKGPEHPDVAASLDNLAWLYHDQAKDADSEAFYQRALAIREKALGPEHPEVATSLDNLAWLYHDSGKHAEIEALYRRALAILEKAYGPEHPDVGQSLHNLAGLYTSQARYTEAEPLYKRALAILEKTFGPEHPNVADALENYADLLHKMGREDEAAKTEARAQAIWDKKH